VGCESISPRKAQQTATPDDFKKTSIHFLFTITFPLSTMSEPLGLYVTVGHPALGRPAAPASPRLPLVPSSNCMSLHTDRRISP